MINGTTQVTAPIAPTSLIDLYPTHDAAYGFDGLRNVDTISDRNVIPDLRRRAGMIVGVLANDTYWRLKNIVWDGTDNDWEPFLTGGGGIAGSGTLNYLSKWTPDGSTLGDSQIYDDGTNIGIGTIIPTAKLHIQGEGSTSATYALKVDNSDSTPLFYVRNDGNVGVGTASPYTLLQADGVISSNRASLLDPTNTTNKNLATRFNLNPNELDNNGWSIGIGDIVSSAYPMWFSTGETNGGGYDFYIGTTKKMSLNGSGDFLLGATTSNAKFNVKGTNVSSGTNCIEATDSVGGNLFVVRNDGNVGIGIVPTAKLQVDGNFVLSSGDMSFDATMGFTSGFRIKTDQPISWAASFPNNVATPNASQQVSHIKLYDDGSNFFGIGLTTGTTIDGVASQSCLNIGSNQTGYGNICLWTNSLRRFTIKPNGVINFSACPTSSVGLVSGDIWSDLGVLTIVT